MGKGCQMSLDLTVISYGAGEILREFFNAVAATMGDDGYKSLIRLTILLAGTTFIIQSVLSRNFIIAVKGLAIYYIAFYLLFLPKVTVNIEDRINSGAPYTVANVPLGLAVIASYSSKIGGALTEIVDQNFTMPDDTKYSKTGMVMASNLVTSASQFQVTDPEFAASLNSFTKQCIFYDLFLAKYRIRDLISTDNIWKFVKEKASPARSFLYEGKVVTCKEGVEFLDAKWETAINDAATAYGQNLFGKNSNRDAKIQLLSSLGTSYGFLLGLSKTGEEIMTQNLMANAIQNGVISMNATTNSPAALQSFAYTKAQIQQRLAHRTIGDMAAHWLPLMRNVFEAIMYGSFIFIFLLTMLPSGLAILRNYVYSLMWLQLWSPLYAIINLIVSFYAKKHSLGIASGGFTLSSLSGLAQLNSDMSGLAGYLSMSVPFIAAGLVKGMSGVFTQIAQYVGGVTQSAATASVSEAASGNISMGNTSIGTHSAFNTSANHFNTMGSIVNGGFSKQLESGSMASMMPDGSLVIDNRPGLSSLGTNIHISQSMRNSILHQADEATTAARSQARNSRQIKKHL
jgi:conjugal transfer mating pair stabilization protein TraG